MLPSVSPGAPPRRSSPTSALADPTTADGWLFYRRWGARGLALALALVLFLVGFGAWHRWRESALLAANERVRATVVDLSTRARRSRGSMTNFDLQLEYVVRQARVRTTVSVIDRSGRFQRGQSLPILVERRDPTRFTGIESENDLRPVVRFWTILAAVVAGGFGAVFSYWYLVVRRALRSSPWRAAEVVDARQLKPPNPTTHVVLRGGGRDRPRLYAAVNLPANRPVPALARCQDVETAGDVTRRHGVMRVSPGGDVLLLRRPSRRSARRYAAATDARDRRR